MGCLSTTESTYLPTYLPTFNAPLMGSFDPGQSFLRLSFGQDAAYFASATQGHLNRSNDNHEGLIRTQQCTIDQNSSDDDLEFLSGHIPIQILHMHKMHIITSLFVIAEISKFMDSHAEKSRAQGRILIHGRKNQTN